jgi:hypothetical protein
MLGAPMLANSLIWHKKSDEIRESVLDLDYCLNIMPYEHRTWDAPDDPTNPNSKRTVSHKTSDAEAEG